MSTFVPDHIVHPPFRAGKDPWEGNHPPPKGYTIKSEQGVFNVFKKGEDGEETKLPYEYITLQQYIQDKITMCNMIADGPL